MWGYQDFGWMGFGMHGMGMVLFWGLAILAVVLLVRAVAFPAQTAPARREDDPQEILRERYARGDLNQKEFQAIREQLAER